MRPNAWQRCIENRGGKPRAELPFHFPPEASNSNDEYGVDRVIALVRQHTARLPAELIAACLDDVRAFTNGSPSFDDMTVLALRRCD